MTSYKKIILRNTATICILFSLFFTVSFYIERYFSSKREYLENAQNNLGNIMEKLDTYSMQVQDLSIIFHSDPDFKDYVEAPYVSPYLRRTVATYIRSTIASLSNSSGITAVTRPDENYIISNDSIAESNYFFYRYGLPSDEINEILASAKSLSSATPYAFFSASGGETYFTVLLVDSSTFAEPYLIFNVYNLKKVLDSLNPDASILISSNGTPLYYSEKLSAHDIDKILKGKNTFKYNTIANSTKTFASLGRLTCTIFLPKIKYVSDINNHIPFTIFSFLILFLISIFISQRISDKTYLPIQKIVDQISDLDPDVLKSDVETISSFISILSRKNTALTKIVANNRNELKEKFINDLLHGYLTDEQVSYGIKTYLSNSQNMLPLAIIIADMQQSTAETMIENNVEVSSLNLVISTMFQQEFENERFFHFTVLSPTSYCTIVSCNDIDTLKSKLRKLLLTIETDLNFDMYSSVSEYVKDWKDLPNVFLSTYFAHTTLKSQEISQTVYSRDEISNTIFYSYEIDNDIFLYCLHREKDQLNKSLSFLVKENFATDTDFANRQSQISILIFAMCIRILTSMGIDSDMVFGKDYSIYLELRSCNSVKEFSTLLQFIFGKIVDYIEKSQSMYEQSYCDDMLSFIHNNYSSSISLMDLAEHMNMSLSYVSRLFKRLTNFNFKDYLSKVRVEQAAKLLIEHPEKSIQQISDLVGFNTVKTFSTMFVRITGMKPSEYRRAHNIKDDT